jgi:LAS superfamily LD-carboxypeptidase LdcB
VIEGSERRESMSDDTAATGARQRTNRARSRVAVVLMAMVALLTLVPADAAPKPSDPKTQREEVRKQKVAVASQLDQLGASSEELQEALDVLDANLRLEEAALENAQAEVDRATTEAAEIQARQAETEQQLAAMEALVKEVAVEAYAKPPIEDDLLTLDSTDLNEAVRKQALLGIVNTSNIDITDQIRGVKAELEGLEDERLAALARAEQAKSDVQAKRDEVATAQAQQQSAADALDARIDRLLSESQALAEKDKALSDQIAAEAKRAAEEAAKRNRRTSGGSGGGSGSIPSRDDMVSVQGIWVHKSIADNLRNLLNAAADDGLSLGGGGYRDSSAQIALRRAHCGSSEYDIWQKPAFQCRPPTARPGTSNHERGLAVDFTNGGSVLTRSSSAFRWLQSNAGRYGFRNLPSEPWHWSVDGN